MRDLEKFGILCVVPWSYQFILGSTLKPTVMCIGIENAVWERLQLGYKLIAGHNPYEEGLWKPYYTWLKDNGYQLRERYAPDWVPSYIAAKKCPRKTLDGVPLLSLAVIDAVRISDGRQVAIKYVKDDGAPDEEMFTRLLSSPEMREKPDNHCVELLEVLRPPRLTPIGDLTNSFNRCGTIFLVLPLLRRVNCPQMKTFGEAIDFFRQLFEGVRFLHRHHIAHRDLHFYNVMYDPTPMYPKGFHPVKRERNREGNGRAKRYTRTTRPPKYIIVDYGLCIQFKPDDPNPLSQLVWGGDNTVPEFQNAARNSFHNPFHTDIYYAGNLIREWFDLPPKDKYGVYGLAFDGFEFMRPLIDKMVQEDPKKRPTIDEVIVEFEGIVKSLGSRKLRSLLKPRKGSLHPKLWLIDPIVYFFKTPYYILTRTPAIPMRGEAPYAKCL